MISGGGHRAEGRIGIAKGVEQRGRLGGGGVGPEVLEEFVRGGVTLAAVALTGDPVTYVGSAQLVGDSEMVWRLYEPRHGGRCR